MVADAGERVLMVSEEVESPAGKWEAARSERCGIGTTTTAWVRAESRGQPTGLLALREVDRDMPSTMGGLVSRAAVTGSTWYNTHLRIHL